MEFLNMEFLHTVIANITLPIKICSLVGLGLGILGWLSLLLARARAAEFSLGGCLDALGFFVFVFGFLIASLILGAVSGGMLGAGINGATGAVIGSVIGLVLFALPHLIIILIILIMNKLAGDE
jgi:hypothetical protein